MCASPREVSNVENTTMPQKEPEELVAYMGLLEVEGAADVAAAANASRDRKCKGLLTAADWAVEFLHTEVACKCIRHIPSSGVATAFGSLGHLPPKEEHENCTRLQSDSSPFQSSPRCNNEALQQTGQQEIGASLRGRYPPIHLSLAHNFAASNRPSERFRALSAGNGSRRVCSVCLLPKIKAEACNGTASTATPKTVLFKNRGAFRVKGLGQPQRQSCCCTVHTYCAHRNPNVRRELVWTNQRGGDEQVCHLCGPPPSGYSPPCCPLPFASNAGVATSAHRVKNQLPVCAEEPSDAPAGRNNRTIGATDQTCTCKSKTRASSARPSAPSAPCTSQTMQSDQTRAFPPLAPSGAPEYYSSPLNLLETSQGTQSAGNGCITKTNRLPYDKHLLGYIDSGGKLQTTPPSARPQTVTTIRPKAPAPLRTGPCPLCSSLIFPKPTVVSFPALPNTTSARRERSPSPEQSIHAQHPKENSANGLQQHLSCNILQQLRTEMQQQLQQQVQQKLQAYMQQIPTSTDQKSRCDQRGDAQILLSPQRGASQDKGSVIRAVKDAPLPPQEGSRWSSQSPATGTATTAMSSGTLGQKPGTSRIRRSRSGPVNGTVQQGDPLTVLDPVPEACAQRIQWLQSCSAEAQGSREKQILATLKELNTRPDFALVDVWRVFDPEGAGISEARGVQDGFSRLGIRCSSQEAQCFIWYYCPPHPIGLTFPIFASLFAAGGDEQLPLLRCIQQQNPCTVPAAYLALSSRTRKLLAAFLRLALDKAISRWVARALKISGLTGTASVPCNPTGC